MFVLLFPTEGTFSFGSATLYPIETLKRIKRDPLFCINVYYGNNAHRKVGLSKIEILW